MKPSRTSIIGRLLLGDTIVTNHVGLERINGGDTHTFSVFLRMVSYRRIKATFTGNGYYGRSVLLTPKQVLAHIKRNYPRK